MTAPRDIDEIARLASEKMSRENMAQGYKGRAAWESMSMEYRFGWVQMVRSVLEAIDEIDGRP